MRRLRKRENDLCREKEDDIENECPEMPDSSKDIERKIHKSESKQCDGESWNLSLILRFLDGQDTHLREEVTLESIAQLPICLIGGVKCKFFLRSI